MKTFTKEDAKEEEKACMICKFSNNCSLRDYVNKLSKRRDNKSCDDEFWCSIFESEDIKNFE